MSQKLDDIVRELLLETYEENGGESPIGLIYETAEKVIEYLTRNPELLRLLINEEPTLPLVFVFRTAHTNEHAPLHEGLTPIAEEKGSGWKARVHSGFFEISEIDERDIAHTYGHDYYGIVMKLETEGDKYRLSPYPFFNVVLDLLKSIIRKIIEIGKQLLPEIEELLKDKNVEEVITDIASRLLVDVVRFLARRLERIGASISNLVTVTSLRDLLDKMFSEEPLSEYMPVMVYYTYPTSLWMLEPDMYIVVEAYAPDRKTLRRLVELTLEDAYPLVKALVELGLLDRKDLIYGLHNVASSSAEKIVEQYGEKILEKVLPKMPNTNAINIIREISEMYYVPLKESRKSIATVSV